MNERILAVWEEDEGQVVLGREEGGRVVEEDVGVPRLQTGSKNILYFSVSFSTRVYSAHGMIPS